MFLRVKAQSDPLLSQNMDPQFVSPRFYLRASNREVFVLSKVNHPDEIAVRIDKIHQSLSVS